MTNKELKLWAQYIGTEVPYHDNRALVTSCVIDMAKKTRKSFTDKDERNFENLCLQWELTRNGGPLPSNID